MTTLSQRLGSFPTESRAEFFPQYRQDFPLPSPNFMTWERRDWYPKLGKNHLSRVRSNCSLSPPWPSATTIHHHRSSHHQPLHHQPHRSKSFGHQEPPLPPLFLPLQIFFSFFLPALAIACTTLPFTPAIPPPSQVSLPPPSSSSSFPLFTVWIVGVN